MTLFCQRVPRLLAVGAAVAGFCLLPPELLARGFHLCFWCRLLHLAACPACGSTRALAAFFHGRWGDALAYNPNVLVTAPTLIALVAKDAFRGLREVAGSLGSGLGGGICEKHRKTSIN
jgi:hypothetical protein